MKTLFLLITLIVAVALPQIGRTAAAPCPAKFNLDLAQRGGQTVFHFRGNAYLKYPLDAIGTFSNQCPKTQNMLIVVDSTVPLDYLLTAINGSGKNQIDHVTIFIRKNAFFIPMTIGNQISRDPRKE